MTEGPAPTAKSPFKPRKKAPLLERTIPLVRDLKRYRFSSARIDVLAGVTVAALAVPASMAYAELAGLSPVVGLYALILPAAAYALFGSSKPLSVGPEGGVSALVAAAILPLAVAGSAHGAELAAMLALMVGVLFAAAWALRLHWLADYLSRPVLIGYIHGVAVVLIVSQLGKLFGLSIGAMDPGPQLYEVADEIDGASGLTFAIGITSLATLLVLRRFSRRFPAQLVVVLGSIALSYAFDLKAHGVPVVGTVPAGLPSVTFPTPPVLDVVKLAPAALGIFFLTLADQILTARAFAGKRGEHIDASQELLAMGVASAAAGMSQGFPVGGSNSRTAVNDSMGARTQVAGLTAAGMVILILLFLTGPISYLPKTVLGAVIISAALGLVELSDWRSLAATDKVEVAIAAAAMACVIVIGVLEGIVVAVALSLVDVVRRSARPHDAVLGWDEELGRYADVAVHRRARQTPGVLVYRLDDRLFFANARYVKGRIREALNGAPWDVRWLVFDAEAVTHLDASGLEALAEIVHELHEAGIVLSVARLKTRPKERLDEVGLTDGIGPDRFYPTVHAAVEACA